MLCNKTSVLLISLKEVVDFYGRSTSNKEVFKYSDFAEFQTKSIVGITNQNHTNYINNRIFGIFLSS